jgi:hypothetical protein
VNDVLDKGADTCGFPELLEAFCAIASRQRLEGSPKPGAEAGDDAAGAAPLAAGATTNRP